MINGIAYTTALSLVWAIALSSTSSAAEAAQKYTSQEAALAALTGPIKTEGKTLANVGDDFDFEEIPADTPTTSNVQPLNISVAGETGQL